MKLICNFFIGVGGVFLLAQGKAKQHVMPDFSKTPINDDDGVNKWLKFFEMSAPLSAVGTLVSKDPVSFQYLKFFAESALYSVLKFFQFRI